MTQSTFPAPCIPLHDFDPTLNGFDSGFRIAGNFSAVTNLSLNVTTSDTIWFFDWNTCAEGGVGGINVNGSSYQTLDGFRVSAPLHCAIFSRGGRRFSRIIYPMPPFLWPRLTPCHCSATRCASTALRP